MCTAWTISKRLLLISVSCWLLTSCQTKKCEWPGTLCAIEMFEKRINPLITNGLPSVAPSKDDSIYSVNFLCIANGDTIIQQKVFNFNVDIMYEILQVHNEWDFIKFDGCEKYSVHDSIVIDIDRRFEEDVGRRKGELRGSYADWDDYNEPYISCMLSNYKVLEDVGRDSRFKFMVLVQHSSLKNQLFALPICEKWVIEDIIGDQFYRLLTDRILMKLGKPQIYGTQMINDPINGGYMLYKMRNLEKTKREN